MDSSMPLLEKGKGKGAGRGREKTSLLSTDWKWGERIMSEGDCRRKKIIELRDKKRLGEAKFKAKRIPLHLL